MPRRHGRQGKSLCHDQHEDDGVDPRRYLSRESRDRNRHGLQRVCAEAQRIVESFLATECEDPRLQCCRDVFVRPLADGSILEVRILVDENVVGDDTMALSSLFRRRLAQAVNRKHCPAVRVFLMHEEDLR